MPATLQPTDQSSDETGDKVVSDVQDSTPIILKPVYISLGLPPSSFKPEVGGDPAV